MIIKEVHIDNFKALNAFSFNPKRINLLVGRNNTGKTSVLEAINYMFNVEDIKSAEHTSSLVNVFAQEARLSSRYDHDAVQLILKKPDTQTTERLLRTQLIDNFKTFEEKFSEDVLMIKKSEFTKDVQEDIEKLLIAPIDNDAIQKLSGTSLVAIQNEKERIYISNSPDKDKLEMHIANTVSMYLSKKFNRKIPFYAIPPLFSFGGYLTVAKKRQVLFIRRLCRQGAARLARGLPKKRGDDEALIFSKIDKLIKEYDLLDNFDHFGVNYDLIFKKDGKSWTVPLALMGDGFQVIISLLRYTLQSHVENTVILIEEPDTHMHPAYVKELADYIIEFSKKRNVQFFITTHNSDLIESFLSPELSESERQFLTDEFSILRMEQIGGRINTSSSDYKTALSDKNELLNDLRGT